jgi:hypothetical protein
VDGHAHRAGVEEMMRALLLLLLVSSSAFANPLRHEDVQRVRPELVSLTSVRFVPKGNKLVEEAREIRTYDATGHIVRHEHRKPDGSLVVGIDFVWANGRIASHTYKDSTKRVERRDFTYKVDAQGRVTEKILRDPANPAGEYLRYVYSYAADGSHRIQSYRHYAKEGPYESSHELVDAQGRTTRSCREHGGCDMNEYDAHGALARVRQQTKDRHHYLSFDTTYTTAGKVATRIVGNLQSSYAWNARGDVSEIVERVIASQGGALQAKTVYTYDYR